MALKESSLCRASLFCNLLLLFERRIKDFLAARARKRMRDRVCNDDTCKRIASSYQSASVKKRKGTEVAKRDACKCRKITRFFDGDPDFRDILRVGACATCALFLIFILTSPYLRLLNRSERYINGNYLNYSKDVRDSAGLLL